MTYKKYLKLRKNKEWKMLFDEQVRITAKTLGIKLDQAEKRYSALLLSGIIDTGCPNDTAKQKEIEDFLMIEQP